MTGTTATAMATITSAQQSRRTATAAGYVLCSVGDLSDPATMAKAVLRYNQSASYVKLVLTWAATYRDGVTTTADSTGTAASS